MVLPRSRQRVGERRNPRGNRFKLLIALHDSLTIDFDFVRRAIFLAQILYSSLQFPTNFLLENSWKKNIYVRYRSRIFYIQIFEQQEVSWNVIRSYDVFFFFFSLSRQTSPLSFNFISSFGIHSCLFFPDFLLRFSPPLCDRSRGGKSESDENYDLKFKQKDGISRYLLTRD